MSFLMTTAAQNKKESIHEDDTYEPFLYLFLDWQQYGTEVSSATTVKKF
jgi:hypothetical protein